MLRLPIALLAGLQPGAVAGSCRLDIPAACRDTNALASSAGFDAAVSTVLGDRRADFLYKGRSVAEQAIDVLGGPPDLPTRIGPYWRFTACRAHSCGEKGAVVLLPSGAIVAVGILHSRCALPQPGADCFAHDTLTLFVRNAGPDVIRDLRSWGEDQAHAGRVAGLRTTTLDAVEVVAV